jgi:3-phenylpropionate/cinnamic acid dioxygenase small subunit
MPAELERADFDRAEISALLHRYARAIDSRNLDDLRHVFTPDAAIEYAMDRGTKLDLPKLVPWLRETLRIFRQTAHEITDPVIVLDGDTAHSICRLVATHIQVELDGRERTVVEGGAYTDEHVRTPEGWRIRTRRLDRHWVEGEYLWPDQVQLFDQPTGPAPH